MDRHRKAIRATYFSMATNLGLAAIKGISGLAGNSFALIADAIESATDVFSSLIVLLGLRYAQKPADENHPYGHGKAEPLVTFLVVGLLIFSAIFIAFQSIHRIRHPDPLPKDWTLIVLGIIILWKEISYRFIKRKGDQLKSSSLKADAWHHRSDAITSVAAFIGISMALLLGEGFQSADDWAALLAAGFILYNSYLIFRPALGEVMDEHQYEELIKDIRHIAGQVKGIKDTEKCLIRKAGMTYHVDLHAIVDANISVREGHRLAHLLKDEIRNEIPEITYVLIHIEPDE